MHFFDGLIRLLFLCQPSLSLFVIAMILIAVGLHSLARIGSLRSNI